MEKVQWKIEGIHCANCALTINKYLKKQGAKNISVNPIDGDVSFDLTAKEQVPSLAQGMETLGYHVAGDAPTETSRKRFLSTHLQRFWFCLPFTAILMMHMIPGLHLHFLMNAWVQLLLCLPVFFVGMNFFARSAIKSLRNGIPNMNVLITIGSLSAFIYSLIGMIQGSPDLYFETAATIITLVFLGEYLEHASVESTQRALKDLVRSQKVMANMIAYDNDHQEHIFPIENTQLKVGDLVLVRTGEQVPADARILWGEASVSEALLTGESSPVAKQPKDFIIGGSIVHEGSVKAQVTAVGNDTVLAGILRLVKKAQGEKPPVQQLADRISAIFVPAVLIISVLTLLINWLLLHQFTPALLRSIAVLVIACPCAMGLATPAAIAVGLGRGARRGILFREARSLELFKNIQQVVFDKTGTLTTGAFEISKYNIIPATFSDAEFKRIVYSLEKYSNHPIARSITRAWKTTQPIVWKEVSEVKGQGIRAKDRDGNEYAIGSAKMFGHTDESSAHSVHLYFNNQPAGWIDVQDQLRPESKSVIDYLNARGIRTILLSGDRIKKTEALARDLGMTEFIAEQSPEQKLQKIEALTAISPTAMVGDGVNDAPALARATIGISMSDASQLAVQSAQVVLMNTGLTQLPLALGLGRHTYITIRQNLFWAFAYNIVAIPIAASGLLGHYGPTYGALIMGLSDVVLAINSARLFVKKVH